MFFARIDHAQTASAEFIPPEKTALDARSCPAGCTGGVICRSPGSPTAAQNTNRCPAINASDGVALAKCFDGKLENGLTLEVGSSVGGVLRGFLGAPRRCPRVEPSAGESGYANQVAGSLVLEVMNFRRAVANFAWLPRAVQIDHIFMFVPEVLCSFVEAAGFQIISNEKHEYKTLEHLRGLKARGLPPYHFIILARKTEKVPFSDPTRVKPLYSAVRDSLRKIPTSRWKNASRELNKTRKRIRHVITCRY